MDAKTATVSGMRHIGTLIAAIVIAPLAWLLLAYGQDRSVQAFATAARPGLGLTPADFVHPFEFLAAAGLLLGIIATLRFSPLGAVVTGLAYTLSYAVLLVAPQGLLDLLSHKLSIAGRHADLSTPVRTGTTLVLGALLLVAVFSVGRWRRWPRRGDGPPATGSDRDRPVGLDGLGLDSPTQPLPGRHAEPEMAGQYRSTAFAPPRSEQTWPWGSSRPVSGSGW
jgi:hypothetical protein